MEWPDIEAWGVRFAAMIMRVIDVLQFVRGEISDKALEAAVSITEKITQITSLFSVGGLEAMQALASGEFVDIDAWGARFAAMIMRVVDVLQFVRAEIENEGLEAATSIIGEISAIASLFGVQGREAMLDLTDTEWPDMGTWGERLAAMIMRGIDVLQYVRGKIGDDGLKAATGIAKEIGEITRLFATKGLKEMRELTELEFPDLTVWGARLHAMITRMIEVLQAVRANISDDALKAAAAIADDLGKVLSVMQIGTGVTGVGPTFMAHLESHLSALEAAAPLVRAAIHRIAANWEDAKALAETADLGEKIRAVFGILDLSKLFESLQVIEPLKEGQRRTALSNVIRSFIIQLEAGAPMLRDGLKNVEEMFDGALDSSIVIAKKIAEVFGNLSAAIKAGIEMTTAEDWNLGHILRMIDEIAQASGAVVNIPEPTFGPPVGAATTKTMEQMDGALAVDPTLIRDSIIEGIHGSRLQIDLSLVQDPRERAEFSMRLGHIEQMFAQFVTRWEAGSA